MDVFIEVAQTLGIPVAILFVFMVWAYRKDEITQKEQKIREESLRAALEQQISHQEVREDLLCKRLDSLEQWQRDKMMTVIEQNTTAFHEFAVSLRILHAANKNVTEKVNPGVQ